MRAGLTFLQRGVWPHFLPSCSRSRGTYYSTQSRRRLEEPVPRQPRPPRPPPALQPQPQPLTVCLGFSHSTGALKSAPSKSLKLHKLKPGSILPKAAKTKLKMDSFVEYKTLRTFPYKFLSKADQHVVSRFFDSKPFHAYGWRMFVTSRFILPHLDRAPSSNVGPPDTSTKLLLANLF